VSSRVVTGAVRLSYCNIFKPRAYQEGDQEKYSCVLLVPKTSEKTVKKIKNAIRNEIEAGKADLWNGKEPKGLWNPLRDGDEVADEHPEYEGMYYINAKSDNKPLLLDEDKEELFDQSEIYSGCWARANISFYAYNNKSKGVGVGLNALMKHHDDEPFGNALTLDAAKKGFEDDDDEDDDFR